MAAPMSKMSLVCHQNLSPMINASSYCRLRLFTVFAFLFSLSVDISSCTQESADLDSAKAVASGVSLCKDLVNSPPNVLTPGSLADAAAKIAKNHGLECDILEVQFLKYHS